MVTIEEKIRTISYHIKLVQDNCYKLGWWLIRNGEEQTGVRLIANSYLHDNSKFDGVEFEGLWTDHPLFMEALFAHRKNNPHHPEYFPNGIHDMFLQKEFFAEMVCDCVARAQQFGTDIKLWFKEEAPKKYCFDYSSEIGQTIEKYLEAILLPKFH